MDESRTRAPLPVELTTARLVLRCWRPDDADALLPVLEANRTHLGPWIPARVADPAPMAALAQRLAGFAAAFSSDREWRFGMFSRNDGEVLGEIDLFPRTATGRVALGDADRAELGYWLRADATGRGFVQEGARAVLDVAARAAQFSCVEIHCDARNRPSVAVAARLGFVLTSEACPSDGTASSSMQVWTRQLSSRPMA
ncbi:MAG TPA: GNAT family N-acetyltransferase [Vicinamibacterales bacterium]|nr:GNAT family N-acetyltransferase [Vicinamibacterales bacterium]